MAHTAATSGQGGPGTQQGLYIVMLSIHGLIRGKDLELGRDADTGGQTKYVVELSSAVARQPGVGRVDLMTRRVIDKRVSRDYSETLEPLQHGAQIVRIEAGPEEYIAKELLWDHLDGFADNLVDYLRAQPRLPDLLHSHYADAGYVGERVSHVLDIPLVHTGHSLGRVKRRRLLASGLNASEVETRYNIRRRIEAEELTLATADRVITSTRQEIEEQYGLYDHYHPDEMCVIPPGTDLEQYHPPEGPDWDSGIARQIARFLADLDKPLILALSRPDPRKNIPSLVIAYGEDDELNEMANLLLIAGNRDDIADLDANSREVMLELLRLIDRYDLYGKVAYPKHHEATDVSLIYRLAAATRGVFVNPALTEPFGLTLIEAAASGLPVVATEDGGPRDIIENCDNGLLIDPLEPESIAAAIKALLSDPEDWRRRSGNGLEGVRRLYSWDAHASLYLELVNEVIASRGEKAPSREPARRRQLFTDRAIFTDIDQNLLGSPDSLGELRDLMRHQRKFVTFGIATGRRLDSALKVMKENGIPEPDVLITSGGTEIHYAPELTEDTAWTAQIDRNWTPHVVRRVLDDLPGLKRQEPIHQSRFKLSYYYDPDKACPVEEIEQLLAKEEQSVNVIVSFGQYLDVMPIQASKGLALRYVAAKWDIALDHILVAGGSGADEDMMRGNTLAAVVGNRHNEELSQLADLDRIYFAKGYGPAGIIEAIEHYRFFEDAPARQD